MSVWVWVCVRFRPLWILRSHSLSGTALFLAHYSSINACLFHTRHIAVRVPFMYIVQKYTYTYTCLCMSGFLVVNFVRFFFHSFISDSLGVKSICRVFSSWLSMKFFFGCSLLLLSISMLILYGSFSKCRHMYRFSIKMKPWQRTMTK